MKSRFKHHRVPGFSVRGYAHDPGAGTDFENVFVPLTIGGGIRDYTDANGRNYTALEVASRYFRSGADKISIGSDAVHVAKAFVETGKKPGKAP